MNVSGNNENMTLKSLEGLLELFLDKVVTVKEKELSVLDGVNRLDDLARFSSEGSVISDKMGNWFAEHNNWLNNKTLSSSEFGRISELLMNIRSEISETEDISLADEKVIQEIDRWGDLSGHRTQKRKIILKRGPEIKAEDSTAETIIEFGKYLENLTGLYKDLSGNSMHLMSVLDSSLKSAKLQKNKEALILSAYIIYYLKQNGYLTEPYVKRLKEAESLFKKRSQSNV